MIDSPRSFGREDFFFSFYFISLLANFLHQIWLVVFLWSLSDNKSPQVSRTILNIISYDNNVAVWIISILSLIFNISSLFPSIWEPFQVHQLQLVSLPSHSCALGFFNSLSIFLSFSFFFKFLFCSPPKRQDSRDGKFFLFIYLFIVNHH